MIARVFSCCTCVNGSQTQCVLSPCELCRFSSWPSVVPGAAEYVESQLKPATLCWPSWKVGLPVTVVALRHAIKDREAGAYKNWGRCRRRWCGEERSLGGLVGGTGR